MKVSDIVRAGLVVLVGSALQDAFAQNPDAERDKGLRPPAEVAASVGPWVAPTQSVLKAEGTNDLDRAANEAMSKLASGLVQEAVPLFKAILKADPNHRKALFGLGTCYVELRQYREAQIVFEKMLSVYPDAFEGLNNLAWMYATAANPAFRDGKKAVVYAQQAVLLAPTSFELWNTLSEAYYVIGDYEKAQRAASEAVKLSVENKAPDRVVREYQRQLDKCRQAAEAMTLIE